MFFSSLSDNIFPKIYPKYNITMIDHDYWRQYALCHDPFNWQIPKGLSNEDLKMFWAQPENHRHFHDTHNTSHCGVLRIVANGRIRNPFPQLSNVTHFINAFIKPEKVPKPKYETLLVLIGHWGHYFQHFFDNIGPQISLAMSILGFNQTDIPVVVDSSHLFPVVPSLWRRLGFSKIIKSISNADYSAKTLIYIESTPRIHPEYFLNLRNMLELREVEHKKVIWLSRKPSNSYYSQRYIINEGEIVSALQKKYGRNNVVSYDHTKYQLNETIELFSEAKIIIGAHGGAFYNQFFSSKDAIIVEIMPVQESGLYPDQDSFQTQPSFSHMAVWSNSLLIGQKFWRYYHVTSEPSFEINPRALVRFLDQIPGNDDL